MRTTWGVYPKMRYYGNCVGWDKGPVSMHRLNYIIDNSRQITRRTFLKYVEPTDLEQLEASLGYSKRFLMSQDWHVSYHKSRTPGGAPVYYFRHSGIEFIFLYRDDNWRWEQ